MQQTAVGKSGDGISPRKGGFRKEASGRRMGRRMGRMRMRRGGGERGGGGGRFIQSKLS
jgi:hypothetical protein